MTAIATQVQITANEMPLERLEAEITELAGHLAAAECRFVMLIAEYDRRAGYEEWGCHSCAQWLGWHCGLNARAARERVRVGRALEELPLLTAQFASGRVSYSKVRAITRVATPQNEAALIEIALHGTAVHVERAVGAYRRVLRRDTDPDPAEVVHRARYLRYDWDDDGSLVGSFRLTPETAAIFLKAVEIARAKVPPEPRAEGGPAGPPCEFAATNSDALMMMAEAFLSGGETRGHGDRFQIVVNVDDDVLRDDAEGICELDGGPAVAPETVRRLACDASIVHAVHDETGQLLATGRKAPAIPTATRRAVHARDRGCRFPGCGGRVFTHIHHVRHRAHFGGNEMTNLVELCWFHHRLVHEGGWNVRFGSNGDVLAIRPNGNVLPRPKPPSPSTGDEIRGANRQLGLTIDPTTTIPRWYGDPLRLDDVVSALVSLETT